MWTRADLKRNGKIAMKRNWLMCAIACFIISFLGGELFGSATVGYNTRSNRQTQQQAKMLTGNLSSEEMAMISTVATVVLLIALITFLVMLAYQILVGNIITVGGRRFFMENREHKTDLNKLFWAFTDGRYNNVLSVMFSRTIKTFLWSLLFIIPGIVKSYEYLMIPYILADNPKLDKERAFELSRGMMYGHKMEAFVLGLSFFGWMFLGALLAGIPNIVYTNPYMMATFSEFYTALKAEAMYKGLTSETELPGFRNPVPDMNVNM